MALRTLAKRLSNGRVYAARVAIRRFFVRIAGVTRFGSIVFSIVLYRGVRNEIADALAAERNYADPTMTTSAEPNLRRNIHRLEKGLIMRPRRLPFGTNFIRETVLLAEDLLPTLDDQSSAWIRDTLGAYFEAHADVREPVVEEALAAWTKLIEFPDDDRQNIASPLLLEASGSDLKATELSLAGLLEMRQSVRHFRDERVARSVVERGIEMAQRAPSGCNRQATRVFLIEDEEQLRIAARLPWGTAGFDHQIPAMLYIVGDMASYEGVHDRHALYVDGSLFAMTLSLALTSLGVSSCFCNWPDRSTSNQAARKLLGLTQTERVVTTMAIGYAAPEALVPVSSRPNKERVLKTVGGAK